MPTLTFKMKDLLPIVEELKKATKFSATYSDLFNPENYPDNIIVDKDGDPVTEEAQNWPDSNKMRPNAIEPALVLAKDQGIYLVSNACLEGTPSSRGTVAYCKGCDPRIDEDWYENARYLYGGDDGADPIPLAWYELAKSKNKRVFKVHLSTNSMSLRL